MVTRNEVPKEKYDENFKNLFNNQIDSGAILATTAATKTLGLETVSVLFTTTTTCGVFTLPSAATAIGKIYRVTVKGTASLTLKVADSDTETFVYSVAANTVKFSNYAAGVVECISGTQWSLIGHNGLGTVALASV